MGLAVVLSSATGAAADVVAYITNFDANTVSVVDTTTNRLLATIPGLNSPIGLATTPDGTKVYVANSGATPGTVSVINTANNQITATITVGSGPNVLAASPDSKHVYVTNQNDGTLSVINTANNQVSATVTLGGSPQGLGTVKK
jgi:YVTN family beta-propeller protein